MTAAEDRAAYEKGERNWNLALTGVILVGVWIVRYWYVAAPAFFWLLFLGNRTIGGLFTAGLATWLCIYLRKRQKPTELAVPPVVDDFNDAAIRGTWNQVADHVRLSGIPAQVEGNLVQRLLAMFVQREPTMAGPEILDLSDSVLGPVMTVRMFEGQEIKNYERACEVLKNLWQVLSVRVDQPKGTNTVRITLVTKDPLVGGHEVTPDSIPVMTSLDYVEVGRMESGRPFNFKADSTSTVIGAVPGAGKSILLSVAMVGMAQRADIALIGIDCKEMLEFGPFVPRLSASAGDQESALEILEKVEEIRKARGVFLREAGFASMKNMGHSPEFPLIVIAIDECAELFSPESSSKVAKDRASSLQAVVSRLVRLGRAMGVIVILATQKPTTDSVPSVIRDNCSQRVALRCTTGEQAKAVLGDDVRLATTSPTEISHEQKGYAVVAEDGIGPSLARAYFISEDTKRAVAVATAHLAIPLDQLH